MPKPNRFDSADSGTLLYPSVWFKSCILAYDENALSADDVREKGKYYSPSVDQASMTVYPHSIWKNVGDVASLIINSTDPHSFP